MKILLLIIGINLFAYSCSNTNAQNTGAKNNQDNIASIIKNPVNKVVTLDTLTIKKHLFS